MKKTFMHALASLLAILAFTTSIHADELRKVWQIVPGERDYITSSANERGIAYNPVTGHVLVVSRSGGANVWILDGETGAEIGTLDMGVDVISGGTFTVNMIGVADDGAIYVGNLALTSTAAPVPVFKLYRWANETATPTLAYQGDPANGESNQRWGDSMDVRGAGATTEVLLGSRANASMAVLRTTNGTEFTSTHIRNAGSGSGTIGIAFGEGNRAWLKLNGQPLRHVAYDFTSRNATLLNSFATLPSAMGPIGYSVANKQLGGIVIATPDTFNLYDMGDLSLGPILVDSEAFETDNANGNGVGGVDFGTNKVYALDTGNGVIAFEIVKTTVPATIVNQPANQTVLEGGSVSLSVTASGSLPLSFQWHFEGSPIANATSPTLTLNNVPLTGAGNYTVVVSNAGGTVTSSNAVLTVSPLVRSDILTKAWQIAPGERTYINTDSTQRGLGYNPVTTNLVLVSRTGGNKIYVLDANTGAFKHEMTIDTAVVSGGTFAVNMVDVADDGAVYVANLNTDVAAAGSFAIYKWENDSAAAVPVTVYSGNPTLGAFPDLASQRRFGDTFDVRGSGANTQILITSRNGTNAVVFTTLAGDPNTFVPTHLVVTNSPNAAFGLGAAFGEGNTFWGKSTGGLLRQVSFPDLSTVQDQTVEVAVINEVPAATVPTTIGPIGFDPATKLLAGIGIENPDNVRLYNVADIANITLVDQELFPTDNGNVNGTGSVRFGGGRLFVLNSNNGIVAFDVNPNATPQPTRAQLAAGTLSGTSFTLNVTGTPNARYRVEATSDLAQPQWTPVSEVTIDADGTVTVTDANAPANRRFYRAVAL